ncbi:hypothetical protein Tco_1468275 [Tanacetum coccineum]
MHGLVELCTMQNFFVVSNGGLEGQILVPKPLRIVQLVETRLMVYIVDLVLFAPQEPFVFNQDPGQNSSQSPPLIDHHCCYECGDSLDDIFCQRCTWDGILTLFLANTKSDEVIKSSVEELVPIPSESEGISDGVCDVPLCDNPTPLKAFKDHSEIVVDSNDDDTSRIPQDHEETCLFLSYNHRYKGLKTKQKRYEVLFIRGGRYEVAGIVRWQYEVAAAGQSEHDTCPKRVIRGCQACVCPRVVVWRYKAILRRLSGEQKRVYYPQIIAILCDG